ncbi:MAG: hypothetical protein ILP18_01160 [Treponema sp.]|nr:hypothetical protein [Treponema sp.]
MSSSLMADSQGAWYTDKGAERDVVLSSRMRLARNLANFPFPARLRGNDGERIQSIVTDAFNHLDNADDFQAVCVKDLDQLGSKILDERGILSGAASSSGKAEDQEVILRKDGRLACTVNVLDHLHISSFAAGLDFDRAVGEGRNIDSLLQKRIQFAASYDYGFLTASVMDAGSGMKLSIRVHLPSLSMLGRIRGAIQALSSSNVAFRASYGAGTGGAVSGNGGSGTSLGSYYDIYTVDCQTGSEYDQIASIVSAGKKIAELERLAREECCKTMESEARNCLYRSLALAKSSIFIPLREGIDIVSGIKWGVDMGLASGIEASELYALLFRIQEGHLEYVLKNGNFTFESDVEGNRIKEGERLRAIILQEAFSNIG